MKTESLGEEQSKRERRRRKSLRSGQEHELLILECIEIPISVKGEKSK